MGDFLKELVVKVVKDKVDDLLPSFLKSDEDEDKDKDKDDGMFSFFKRDDDDDDKKKKKEKDDDGNFFSKFLNKDDEDLPKKTGFEGLYTEQGAAGSAQENEGGSEEFKGSNPEVENDLLQDLMDVAEETSTE